MKNSELEIYFTNEKIKWNYIIDKEQYELNDLYLTLIDLKKLISMAEFFNFSICVCPNKFIVHCLII